MAASRGIEVSYLSLHLLIANLEDDGIPSLKLDARSNTAITTLNAYLCVRESVCVCVCVCVCMWGVHNNVCIQGVYK